MSIIRWFVISLLLSCNLMAQVITYVFPAEMPVSKRYGARIDGKAVPALQTARGAFLSFGMKGPVEVEVELPAAPKEVVIRPLSSAMRAEINGSIIRFRLPRPMNLSLEIDGDLADPLFVFANRDIPTPDRTNPKVRFFEAGKIHNPGEILLEDGESLFIEGGAVVRADVRALAKRKVSIAGAGILDAGSRRNKINMLVLRECKDSLIEDVILLDPLGWTMHVSGSENIRISNTRVIGWRANSDGLDIEHSSHVTVDGCFWRTNDDCIAIKAIYPPGVDGVPFGEMINPETLGGHDVARVKGAAMEGIDIRNCVLWNDEGGQGFEIGFELRVDHIRNITFRDSDIIHVIGGGAFTIHNGDRARIENIQIENIRVENTDRFVDFHIGLSIYSRDCPMLYQRSNPQRKAPPDGHRPLKANNPYQWFVPSKEDLATYEEERGWVRGVVFRNISIHQCPPSGSFIMGFSPARMISDVLFENVMIGGRPVRSAEDADLYLIHAENISFAP